MTLSPSDDESENIPYKNCKVYFFIIIETVKIPFKFESG
jgi:hypothetical protein